jgi:hypothetical protein
MKKAVARTVKTKKLKEQKNVLIDMHDEMVLLIEQFRKTTIIQAQQIEELIGRTWIHRLVNVFTSVERKAHNLEEIAVKKLQEFKKRVESVNEDSPS